MIQLIPSPEKGFNWKHIVLYGVKDRASQWCCQFSDLEWHKMATFCRTFRTVIHIFLSQHPQLLQNLISCLKISLDRAFSAFVRVIRLGSVSLVSSITERRDVK